MGEAEREEARQDGRAMDHGDSGRMSSDLQCGIRVGRVFVA